MSSNSPWTELVQHPDRWDYAYCYGILSALTRYYLRGDITREHFTAAFAQLDMAHSLHMDGVTSSAQSGGKSSRPDREGEGSEPRAQL